jgi:spermidine/putrescine transport system substrate-binding protein
VPANPLKTLYEMRRAERALEAIEAERGLSRRDILRRGAFVGAGAVVGPGLLAACGGDDDDGGGGGGGGGSSDELNILTWEGYHQEPWLQEFTKDTGIKVNATNVGSPAEMFSKVKANPGQFDIILNTSGWFDQYVASDLIVPIDESKVPNVKEISDAFPWRDATSVKGKNYAILYTWGDQPLGWNSDEVPGNFNVDQYLTDGVPNDWNILWDPQFKGRVTVFDDPTSVEPMIPLALGFENPYKLDDAQFEQFEKKLYELRPQVKKLTSGFDDQANTFINGEAIIGYVNHTLVVVEANKKGTPIEANHTVDQGVPAWSDNLTITKEGGSKKLDAAYEFINSQIELPWQARLVKTTGNTGTLSYDQAKSEGVTDEELEPTLIPLTREGDVFFEKMVFFQAVEDLDRRLEVWNEFKLGIGT